MQFKDYYKVMGLSRDATQEDIKRAYRKLARQYHPDVSQEADAEERFKELGEAYEVLKDPEKRAAYDQLGSNWQTGQDFRPPPEWDQGFEFHGGGFTGADASQFSDFFESLFGRHYAGTQQRGAHFHASGDDAFAKILIDLKDAYEGANRTITIKITYLDAHGHPELKDRKLNVHIPKGVRPGQHIRLTGQGDPGFGQGKPGDLYLEIAFNPHADYHVEGHDVFVTVPVTPWEAALGAIITATTPIGKFDIKVPAESASGRKLRLKGRGIPGKPPGDLYVVLNVVLPPANSESAKKAYKEMAEKFAFNPRKSAGV